MHVELTTRCTLECPGCPRTIFSKKFKRPFPKHDLCLEDFKSFLDCKAGRALSFLEWNGNHGDIIYHPQVLSFLSTFRDYPYFISTSGANQKEKFWHEFAARLDQRDVVTFSIDGLEHNNHIYRVNSKWESCQRALKIVLKSPAKVIWKTVTFSFNENEIDKIRSRAESMGALFVAIKTHRFGDDQLKPSQKNILNDRKFENSQNVQRIEPKCPPNEFVSALGYYTPCCWVAVNNIWQKTHFYKERDQSTIKGHTLDELREKAQLWSDSLRKDPSLAYDICRMHCKPGQGVPWAAGSLVGRKSTWNVQG